MEGLVNSEVPGLEGRPLIAGSAAAEFAGAAKHWHTEAQKWKEAAQLSRLKWFLLGALTTAAGFFSIWAIR